MSHAPTLPERPVDPGWLALREPADTVARDAARAVLLPPLLEHLRRRLGREGLHVVDLGAGTGANLRYLGPELAELVVPQSLPHRWTMVDHDPRLQPWGPIAGVSVQADVTELAALLADRGPAHLVTAAALLDLLTSAQLDAVVAAVAAQGIPVLFSLSVTGDVVIDPADPLDLPLRAAFDAHQRRDGRLGPDASAAAVQRFTELGWHVLEAPTPWRLNSVFGQAALMDEWLAGRADAAAEWDAALIGPAGAWLSHRRAQLAGAGVLATVAHTDVLALPPS